jgi:hypothetical protein
MRPIMATAKRRRGAIESLHSKLPTAAEAAAEIQVAARRLGLLLDLHRVAMRLREIDQAGRIRSST